MGKPITIRCPKCGTSKAIDREPYDPTRAAVIETDCLDCAVSGDFESVTYFGEDGREVMLHDDEQEPPR